MTATADEVRAGLSEQEALAEIKRLAALAPLSYDRKREAAAKAIGCRTATLDAEVARHRQRDAPEGSSPGQGHEVAFNDPEPWPEAVEGCSVLDALAATAARHLVLPPGAAAAIALWVMHTHAHEAAAISPILAVTSPTPACGKTTLLTVLGALVPRPLPASNITAAALFRAVERWRPTLLIDEADTFLRDSDDLRGILNSGHALANAWVIRTVGDDHEPRRFRTWAPKAVALIGKLPPTLGSRSVHVELRRMAPDEHAEPLRADRLGHLLPLHRQTARWVQDHANELSDADPAMGSLRGRIADNWRPLFAIADLAGGRWAERARRAAATLTAGRDEDTAGVLLLADIARLFAERSVERLPSSEIVDALVKMDERPWPEWGRAQRPITARQLAKLLQPFGVRSRQLRLADGRTAIHGYLIGDFEDALRRYYPDRSATTLRPLKTKDFRAESPATEFNSVADGSTENLCDFRRVAL